MIRSRALVLDSDRLATPARPPRHTTMRRGKDGSWRSRDALARIWARAGSRLTPSATSPRSRGRERKRAGRARSDRDQPAGKGVDGGRRDGPRRVRKASDRGSYSYVIDALFLGSSLRRRGRRRRAISFVKRGEPRSRRVRAARPASRIDQSRRDGERGGTARCLGGASPFAVWRRVPRRGAGPETGDWIRGAGLEGSNLVFVVPDGRSTSEPRTLPRGEDRY